MFRHLMLSLNVGLLAICAAGCCCVQGMPAGGSCGLGCNSCGPGPVAALASCRGGCDEVYVDEWISEPPTVDNCGFDCGGCGRCGSCQPLRNMLRLLWGQPYYAGCSSGLCGPSCDSGCSSCDSAGDAFVHDYSDTGMHLESVPYHNPSSTSPGNMTPQPRPAPQMPMEVVPEIIPNPDSSVMPSSARRLNPAARRRM